MAPGMMGRLSDRFHHKSSPTKLGGASNPRASTPNKPSPSARSPRKSPHKHLRFGRSAISKASDALKSSKKLVPEPSANSIFSSPIRPQLDSAGKPACVRYIATYSCSHNIIEQHPCGEHEPAFCLDDGHCVTANMKKNRKCNDCSVAEVAQMLDTTSQSFPNPLAPPDHPMMNPRASPAARSAIKSRIAKRIAELGPLGEIKSSPQSVRKNKDYTTEHAITDASLFTVAEFLRDEVANTEAMNDGDSNASSIRGLSPAVLAAKNALIAKALARNRAVSEAPLSTTTHKDSRAVSASFRPLPPLPTPVNFDADAMADKAYKTVSREMIDLQISVDAQTDQNERENAANRGAIATHINILSNQVSSSSFSYTGTEFVAAPHQSQPSHEDAKKHGSFVAKAKNTEDKLGSTIFHGSDISELTLSNEDDGYDPFVDRDADKISSSAPRNTDAGRPLPSIPSRIHKRHSMPSPSDRLEKLLVASRSMQNMAQIAEEDPRSSPAPLRQTPKLPSTAARFADFDFHLEYARGKIGYIGRMGQMGSGDDFIKDWKLEYPTLDYSKDETATGELWENKHGYGYSGLKRYLNKQKDDTKANKRQGNPVKIIDGDGIHFSSPRPNKESTIWSRRWARNVGFSMPAPVLNSEGGAGKTDIDCIIKKDGGQTIVLQSARKETFKSIPWDRTMIGCAL